MSISIRFPLCVTNMCFPRSSIPSTFRFSSHPVQCICCTTASVSFPVSSAHCANAGDRRISRIVASMSVAQ